MAFSMENLPQVGDVIDYRTRRSTFLSRAVTGVRHHDGFTDVWFDGGPVDPKHRERAPFNINHTTGLCNTSHSEGGTWKIVSRSLDREMSPAATLARIQKAVAEAFSDHQYSFDGDSYPWKYAATAVAASPGILPATIEVPPSPLGLPQAENYIRVWADQVGVKVTDLAVLLANEWLEAQGVERP